MTDTTGSGLAIESVRQSWLRPQYSVVRYSETTRKTHRLSSYKEIGIAGYPHPIEGKSLSLNQVFGIDERNVRIINNEAKVPRDLPSHNDKSGCAN